jgi:hypothetical protein
VVAGLERHDLELSAPAPHFRLILDSSDPGVCFVTPQIDEMCATSKHTPRSRSLAHNL